MIKNIMPKNASQQIIIKNFDSYRFVGDIDFSKTLVPYEKYDL